MAKASKPVRPARATRKITRAHKPNPPAMHLPSWMDGYHAGMCHKPIEPPKGADKPSWVGGYTKGYAHDLAGTVTRRAAADSGNVNLENPYRGATTVGWINGLICGIALGRSHKWVG